MTTAGRRHALAAAIADAGLDAALITRIVNVRYLTGFTGSNAALLVDADGSALLATDGRYRDQATSEAPDVKVRVSRDLHTSLLDEFSGVLGVETHALSVDQHSALAQHTPDARLVSSGRLVEALREVKDDEEIAALRQACDISVAALTALIDGPIVGRSERELARDLEWGMLQLGAEAIAFETILASGPNSAVPHHRAGDRVLQRGDLLKIDFGARVDGYHADCTRTFALGRAADWQREIHASVLAAQEAGIEALGATAVLGDARKAVDDSLSRDGHLEHFTTGLGHGVGLEIHEDPYLSSAHTGKVVPRIALTVEPGIYLSGRGGVRIEDTLITTDGAPLALTDLTKELLEL